MKTRGEVVQRACCFLVVFAATAAFGQTAKWNHKAAMPTPRSGVRAAVVGGKLFAVGGYVLGEPRGPGGNRELDTPVATVEVYDPQKDVWKSVAPLPVAGGLDVAAIGNTLYAVVGTTQAVFACLWISVAVGKQDLHVRQHACRRHCFNQQGAGL